MAKASIQKIFDPAVQCVALQSRESIEFFDSHQFTAGQTANNDLTAPASARINLGETNKRRDRMLGAMAKGS